MIAEDSIRYDRWGLDIIGKDGIKYEKIGKDV